MHERRVNVNKLPIKEVGPILTYQLWAAAMAKNQPALRDAVSKAINDVHADGTIRSPVPPLGGRELRHVR